MRDALRGAFQACRAATLSLFSAAIQDGHQGFRQQAHPDFSPAGWHLGHIGYTEALWVLEHMAQMPPSPEYRVLFAQNGLPKAERQNLPAIAEIVDYLDRIRIRVLDHLSEAPVDQQMRLWWFLLQHESQHAETIAVVHRLLERSNPMIRGDRPTAALASEQAPPETMVYVSAGPFQMGSDDPVVALDNEGPSQSRYLDAYWIDQFPVTCASYRRFMQAGGYQTEAWWSPRGWQWLQRHPVSQPLYWRDEAIWDSHPVCGVSWYEAEAYANFVGKRLPTEAEWEKAACWCPQTNQALTYPLGGPPPRGCNYGHRIGQTTPVNAAMDHTSPAGCADMLGNVWEWTADRFEAYPQFTPYPYAGYSQAYFDHQHYVLRGGSWSTQFWALRPSFRNWYAPDVRQIFSGFRCASSIG
ncbi:MAG: SUMF1/EgtB/PvdO family nonheme iron enzyme [Elainellaceae cyanobacterium]